MDMKIETILTYSDFPKICRFCLKFGKVIAFKKSYMAIFHKIIEANDLLPQNACDECINKLEIISDFIEMCKYTNDFLTNVVISEQDKQLLQEMLFNEKTNNSIIVEIVSDASNEEYFVYEDEDVCLVSNHNALNSEIDRKSPPKTQNEVKTEMNYTKEQFNKGVLKKKIFKCKICGKKFRNLKSFKVHSFTHVDTKNKTDLKSYKCKLCNKKFAYYLSLRSHNITHHSPKVIKSESLHLEKQNEKFIQAYEDFVPKIVAKERKWKCIECNKLFGKKNDLQRHLCIHTGVKPYACTLCPLAFIQRSSLNRHIKAVHTKKEKCLYECYICERKFNRKNNIQMHVAKTHVKKINEDSFDNPFKKSCDLCGKTFSTYSYTKQHAVAHMNIEPKPPRKRNSSGLKKFKYPTSSKLCSFCGKSFEKRSSLYVHISRNHRPPNAPKMRTKPKNENIKPKKVFQCWQCGQTKSTHCNLKVHMRIHTGEKPYECKFCFKKFSAWSSWQEHENIHTGVKPYQCELCKKGFKHRSSLRKHMMSGVHSKTKKK